MRSAVRLAGPVSPSAGFEALALAVAHIRSCGYSQKAKGWLLLSRLKRRTFKS